jgi:hypothetical protein
LGKQVATTRFVLGGGALLSDDAERVERMLRRRCNI